MSAKKGDKVKIEYTGTLEDGTVFDSSKREGGEPIEFTIGEGKVLKPLEDAVIGMEKGEKKKIQIKADDGYGQKRPELEKKLSREQLPKDQEPKPGMQIILGLENGQQVPALITDVEEKEIAIDLNHPLAGKDLSFDIELL